MQLDVSAICWRFLLESFGGVVNLHLQVYVHVVLVDVARSTSGLLDAPAKRANSSNGPTSVGSETFTADAAAKKGDVDFFCRPRLTIIA